MAADAQVVRMERPGRIRTFLNKANADTGVSRIHQGEGLSSPYTGKGVLALMEDVGFYPGHVMFKNADGSSKVEHLRGSDGKVYTQQADIEAYKIATDLHGTHVASPL